MSNTVGGANVEITADDSQARGTVSRFFGFLSKTGQIAAGVATGMAIFEGITRGMQRLSSSTIGANASLEQSAIAWKTLLGSGKAAEKMMKDISDFTKATPFETEHVDIMAKYMHNAGLEGKDLFNALMKVSDVAGAFAIPAAEAKEMTRQMAQVRQAGVAYTEDLNILQDRGVPIYRAIAEQLNITVAGVKKMAGEGKLTSDIYIKSFDRIAKSVEGASKAQSETFNGLISTANDSLKIISSTLSKPIFEKLSNGLKTAMPVLEATTKYVQGDVTGALESLNASFGEEKTKKIMNFFNNLKTGVDKAKAAFSIFKDFISGLFAIFSGREDKGSAILESLGFSASQVQQIINAINLIKSYINTFIDVTVTRYKIMGQFFIDAWKVIWPYLQPLLTKIVSFVGEKVQQIVDFWEKDGAQIMQAVKNVFNGILAIIKFIMPAVMFIVEMVWSNIKGVIDGALKIIMGLLKVFAGLFTGDFSKMWEGIKQLFVGAVQFIWNLVNLMFIGKLLGGVKSLATGFVNWIRTLASGTKNNFSNMVSGIIGFFENLGSSISNAVVNIVRVIKNNFTNAKDSAVNAVKGLFTGAKQWFDNLLDKAIEIANNLVSSFKKIDLLDVGKDIINGLIKGISSMAGAIKEKVEEMASNLPGWMKKVLGIHSPSKVMADQVGQHLPTGIAEGINKTSGKAKKAAEKVAKEVAAAAKNAAAKYKKDFETAYTGLDYKFDAGKISLTSYMNALEGLKKKYASVPNAIARVDKTIVELRKKHAKELFEIDKASYENKVNLGQLNWKQELKMLGDLAKRYKKGSEERAYFEEKIYNIKKDIHSKLTDLNRDYVQKAKDINAKLLEDEHKAEENYSNKVAQIQEKLVEDKSKALEDYEAKVKEVNDRLIAEEQRLNDEYAKALEDRTNSLYSFAGIFDEITKKDISGSDLLKNLGDQVDSFREWQQNITTLSQKGISDVLLKELQDMGPKAADEIAALTKLSDAELQQYSNLWAEKHRLAADAASRELEGFRIETLSKLQQLRVGSVTELDLLKVEYNNKIMELTNAANAEIAKHKLEWETEVKNLRLAAANELSQMKIEWLAKIKELTGDTKKEFDVMKADMNTIGKDTVAGLMAGMKEMEPALRKQAQDMANVISKTIQSALKIKSPSRVLKALGGFAGEGLLLGLDDKISGIKAISKKMAEAAIPNIKSFKLPSISDVSGLMGSIFNISGGSNQPIILQTVLPDGRVIAEATYPDINKMLYGDMKIASRTGGTWKK